MEMDVHSGQELSAKSKKQRYVFFIHGIRTTAGWITDFEQYLAKENIESGNRDYGRFPLIRFLFPTPFLPKILDLIRRDITTTAEKGYDVTVVAHSFGAYLIYRLLRKERDLKIANLILCGAVIRRWARWFDFAYGDEPQIKGTVINLCGTKDPFPLLAELVCKRFGSTGTKGAGDPWVKDRFFDIGHSGFFTADFYQSYFKAAICEGAVQGNKKTHPWYINALIYLCSHKFETKCLLACLAGFLVWTWWVRPPLICSFFQCAMNVYREDDLRGSYQEDKKRKFVRSVRMSYVFDFATPSYTSRFWNEPGVSHPNVFELNEKHMKRQVQGFQDSIDNRMYSDYPISVYNYRADTVLELQGGDRPEASSFIGRYQTKNLEMSILVPPGVILHPCTGDDFTSGVRPPKYAQLCKAGIDGQTLACEGINLPAESSLNYYFKVTGWDEDSDNQPCKFR
jgi:pimeloyl-ACP methyl ester carboxylesterase